VRFSVGEGKITMLDQEGNEITGELAANYILAKVNPALLGKKWKLSELAGKEVDVPQEAYIMLDAASNSVSGNLGCNDFTGSYELKNGNRIKFSRLAVTQKMCLNMEIEDGLKKTLETVDNYNIADSKLILNRARMAPLAVFE
jgi:heat shock protein HslJ